MPDAIGYGAEDLYEPDDGPFYLDDYFEDLDGSEPGSRPETETQCILRDVERGRRAGKSYKPDPTGERYAITASSYRSGTRFFATKTPVDNLYDVYNLLKYLAPDPTAFLIRGKLAGGAGTPGRHRGTGEYGYMTVRRTIARHGPDGAFEPQRRRMLMLDLDGIQLPSRLSMMTDPEACILWAVEHLFPPEFHDVDFVYQLSSSAGLTKSDDQLNAHLWYFTDRPLLDDELRRWALWWNAKQQKKIIDHALYTSVQPHYVNDPELLDGLVDPFAGHRLGWIRGNHRTVPLYLPNSEEISVEARLKSERAKAAATSLRGKMSNVKQEHRNKSDTERAAAEGAIDESTNSVPLSASNNALADPHGVAGIDAVRDGSGWRGYLNMIGFEGHIRTQIRAAIGSYFYEHGSRGDRRALRDAITQAVNESPFFDCGEPWSRRREEALAYLEGPADGILNVDEMIRDFARYQRERERSAEQCEPTWALPTRTAAEAYDELEEAITSVVAEALKHRSSRLDAAVAFDGVVLGGDDPFDRPTPTQTAILCETGVGKTEAVLRAIRALLSLAPDARAVIAVPTHDLGKGLAERINHLWGIEIAREWKGSDQEDTAASGEKMCRLAEEAAEVVAAGGKIPLLCSSRDRCCPHHPREAGAAACGYQRQQIGGAHTRVWIIPANMLANAPPAALRRPGRSTLGDFDLLVIDEAPWLGLLGGHDAQPEGAPYGWLAPGWWSEQPTRARDEDKAFVLDVMGRLYGTLSECSPGPVPIDVLLKAGIHPTDLARTKRVLWRWKRNLRGLVRPGSRRKALAGALAPAAAVNKRVLAVTKVLEVITLGMRGYIAPSGVELIDLPERGGLFLRIRWRKNIHPAWLQSPVVCLDAAGTGTVDIAKAWIPHLNVAVEARATAPHMRIMQINDTQMSYRAISEATSTLRAIARVVQALGGPGLVVCPKKLRDDWDGSEQLPKEWLLWNFNAIRGRDEARSVPELVIISRPMPRPSEVELIAETIFGRGVERLPADEFYSKVAIGRLMADGTGRRALVDRHPDPLVEAVRFSICEGELLQAVGRGRGVRRDATNPLFVLILTNVPVPLPVDIVLPWVDLRDATGPFEVLSPRGIVPLDYAGMAAALPDWFTNDESVTEWFRTRPEARARLRSIAARAKRDGWICASDFLGNPYRDILIGNSQILRAFRYRRIGSRQSNVVLVDLSVHDDPRAAVEAVIGGVDLMEPLAAPDPDEEKVGGSEAFFLNVREFFATLRSADTATGA